MASRTIETSKLAPIYYEKLSGIAVDTAATRRPTNRAIAWSAGEYKAREAERYERQNLKPRFQM